MCNNMQNTQRDSNNLWCANVNQRCLLNVAGSVEWHHWQRRSASVGGESTNKDTSRQTVVTLLLIEWNNVVSTMYQVIDWFRGIWLQG